MNGINTVYTTMQKFGVGTIFKCKMIYQLKNCSLFINTLKFSF